MVSIRPESFGSLPISTRPVRGDKVLVLVFLVIHSLARGTWHVALIGLKHSALVAIVTVHRSAKFQVSSSRETEVGGANVDFRFWHVARATWHQSSRTQ